MPETDQRSKVTVEDLLRLKRAERPAPEFWANFERELRQKQLTALIEKRPWWQELPQLLARRIYLPVGATAILAFTLVSIKYYAPAQLGQVAPAPLGTPVAFDRDQPVAAIPVSSPLVNRSESAAPEVEESVAATTPAATEVVELMPLLAPRQAETPSARLLAANLTHLEQSDVGFDPASLGNLSPAAREQAIPAAELASVPTTSNRRNRLLARYDGRQVSPEPSLPEVVRQKLTRGLGDPEPDRGNRLLARELNTFSTPMPQIVALRF
jgi:hypothetical protein